MRLTRGIPRIGFPGSATLALSAAALLLAVAVGRPVLAQGGKSEPPPEATAVEPAEVLRGMPVKILGKGLNQAKQVRVRLNQTEVPILGQPAGDGTSVTFRIPADFPLGRCTVRLLLVLKEGDPPLVLGVPTLAVGNQLRIVSDTPDKVKVTGIFPQVGYPEDGVFNLVVVGEGFSLVPTDNQLSRQDSGALDVTWVTAPPTPDQLVAAGPGKVFGRVVSSRQLEFWGIPLASNQGKVKFQIRVGDNVSDPMQVTLARVPKAVPWVVALGVVALLAGLVYFAVASGLGRHRIGAASYGPLAAFFLDPETDTLSLSKFQLYTWTVVAVFGYAYLTIARSLIQGVFEFAPIPTGLPGILGVSVGTAALAAGINNARGPKGAGNERPSVADLITMGGVVVAERFQFLIWTLLGALAFLFLVVFSDPATIQDLPKVPEGFLYLMGVSSAGYLGGKLARKPGPVIDTIVAQQGSVVIDIQGRNLSKDASFYLDDMEVTHEMVGTAVAATALAASVGVATNVADPVSQPAMVVPSKDAALLVVTAGEDFAQTGFATALRLRLRDEEAWLNENRKVKTDLPPAASWIGELQHRLTLVNPDGQKAVWSFTIQPKAK